MNVEGVSQWSMNKEQGISKETAEGMVNVEQMNVECRKEQQCSLINVQ
jgi:hypothetical protein